MSVECARDENIVRGITTAHLDQHSNRLSSLIFKGANISVSRLRILTLSEIFVVFYRTLHKPSRGIRLLGAGNINVGKLQDIGASHTPPCKISVIISPTRRNPAHAEIPQKIKRNLAKKIKEELVIHDAPPPPDSKE